MEHPVNVVIETGTVRAVTPNAEEDITSEHAKKRTSYFNSTPFYHSKVLVRLESIGIVKPGLLKKNFKNLKTIKNSQFFLLRFFNVSYMSVEGFYLQ